jgi:hypothetical protein
MQGNPVDARGFHGNRSDAALLQPVSETVKIAGESWEMSNRLVIPVRRNGNEDFFCPDICASGIRLQNMQRRRSSLSSFVGHGTSCKGQARRPGARKTQTPNRDRRREANVITKLYAAPDPRLTTGFR